MVLFYINPFGCGAFKNPPEVVTMAFREVIEQEDYDKYFKRFIFKNFQKEIKEHRKISN